MNTTFDHALLPLAGTDDAGPVRMRARAQEERAREKHIDARPSFFARLLEAMIESRRAQAMREIARVQPGLGSPATGTERTQDQAR